MSERPTTSWFGALKVYGDRRTLVILLLGFASGLPNLLIFDTLSAWLRESGLSLEVIGFFSLATLAYSFKFVWAPLVDRARIPILHALLGHRRAWMLVAQAAIIVGLALVAGSDPATNLGLVALFAVFTGFASATQDIVIDAWRIEAAEERHQGAMAAAYQWGYRMAVVVAGAAPLVLAESYGWSFSYAAMAALMGIGVIAVIAAPRETVQAIVPRGRRQLGTFLYGLFAEPLVDFWTRFGRAALLILALICLYRVSDFVLNIMNPFYLDLGFTKTEIAEVRKIFGVVMSMLGVFLGGWAIARYGLIRPLMIGALAGPVSNLVFVWLASQGPSLPALFVAIGTDNVASGFSGTCLIAYMSSLTSAGFTATQYALFSSLYSLPGKLIASQSGRIVEGAARDAQAGGVFAPLIEIVSATHAPSLIEAAARLGVGAGALAAGYGAFFIYSFAIGLIAIVLAAFIARRK